MKTTQANVAEARISMVRSQVKRSELMAQSQMFARGARVKCASGGSIFWGAVVDETPGNVGVCVDGKKETEWFCKRTWAIAMAEVI